MGGDIRNISDEYRKYIDNIGNKMAELVGGGSGLNGAYPV